MASVSGHQMAFVDRHVDRPLRALCRPAPSTPTASRTGPGAGRRTRPRAGVDPARVGFSPKRAWTQARTASATAAGRAVHAWRVEHLFLELAVVSRITEICSSSREPRCANTPDLLICVTSASAPSRQPFEPHVRGQPQRGLEDPWHASAGPFCRPCAARARSRVSVSAVTVSCPVRADESNESFFFAEPRSARRPWRRLFLGTHA